MSRERERLLDEIALREASLIDAQRELDAGELSRPEFVAIETRERSAVSSARDSLAALRREPASPMRTPRHRRARWLVLALGAFALALGVLLWAAVAPRQAGNSITGSLTLGRSQAIQQLLAEAQGDTANGHEVAALYAYQEVLHLDARNVVALTQSGWLDFSAGSAGHQVDLIKFGIEQLRRAMTVAPRDAAPRLYYAIAADSTPGNRAIATSQFRVFLNLTPSPGLLAIAHPFLVRLGLAAS